MILSKPVPEVCPTNARKNVFVARSFALGLALLGAASVFGQPAPVIVRGPYLQSASTSNIIVRWRTDLPTESRVHFGTVASNLNLQAVDPTPITEHAVTLPDLAPGTKYFYSILAAPFLSVGGPSYAFTTAPSSPKPTRIWAIGDVGTASLGSGAPLLVRDAYASHTGSRATDVWLMLGDNAYYSGTDAEYQAAVFDVFQDLLRTTPLWPTLGNHETYGATPDGQMAYDDIFNLPQDGRAGGLPSGSERYYSFDYGNIHFVSLDSELASKAPGGPMLAWLEQDLAATESDWIIAFWHSPPYSKGSHDSDFEANLVGMREQVVPILETYGVDLVLCGHSHNYERSFLLNGHYGSSPTLTPAMVLDAGSGRSEETGAYNKSLGGSDASRGAVYVVAGSAGQTGFGSFDHPAMFIARNDLGSLVIDIDGNRLDAEFLRENGQIDDHFTIIKGDQPPSIVTQPINQTTAEGATASFNVVVAGTRPLSYQWRFNDNPIADETNAVLTLNNVSAAQAGQYSVVVSNPIGSVTSAEALLTVNPATVESTYDLSRDFSPTINPNGVWSFGAKASLGGPLSLFGIHGANPFEYWQLVPGQEPSIYRNGSLNTVVIGGSLTLPPGTVWIYSGSNSSSNQYGVIRFTVPAGGSGDYLIQSDVRPVYDGVPQGDTDFHVVRNGAELFGLFLAPAERSGYTNTLALAPGDTIEFLIGRGQDNNNYGSGLKIEVTITPTSTPPPNGLVVNGSFELGTNPGISAVVSAPNSTTITGWAVETASVDYIGTRWTAGNGVRCLDLSGIDAGTISQTIMGLTLGQSYRLSFLMAGNPEVGLPLARLRAQVGAASQEFSFNPSGFSPGNMGWTERTMDFVAAAPSEELSFTSLNPGWAGAALDRVAIVASTNTPPPPPPPPLVTYDVGRDFALINPNGVWSYGYQSMIGGQFNLLTSHQTLRGDNGLPILLWHFQSAPAIYANTNDTTAISGGEPYPPHTAWCYAGPEGSDRTFAVMRFTVPINGAGVYSIASAVAPRISSGGDDSDFHVAKNGVELFGQQLGATESGGYTNSLELQGGDTVDLLVGRGANGGLFGSGLKIQATISLQTNTPPPPPVDCVPASTGLVAWWPLNGNPSDRISGASLGLSGGPTYGSGEVGQGLQFDGANDEAIAPVSPTLNVGAGDGFSIEAWVNPSHVTMQPLVEWGAGPQIGGAHFWIGVYGSGSLYANLADTGGTSHSWRSDVDLVVPNVNQHVGMTYHKASGMLRFYLNGSKVTEYHLGSFTPQTTYPMGIGFRPQQEHYSGTIDELSIYDRVLGDAEFSAIFHAGAAGKCVSTNQPPPPPQVTFDVGRDFALTNPNGVWSYGYKSMIGGQFNLLTSKQTLQGENGVSILLWHFQTAPAIYANTNDTIAISGGEVYPSHAAWCYAGPEGSDRTFAAIRFTVPASGDGNYIIASAVSPRISNGADDSDFHVAKNGVELFGQFLGATESGGYTNSLDLLAGDTIDFLVGRGANGRLSGSGLKILATISLQTATPHPPQIVAGPRSQTVTRGSTVAFSVSASGTAPLSYQWFFNDALIDGANASILTLNDVQLSQSGNYSVSVSNALGTAASDHAVLVVNPPPATVRVVSASGAAGAEVSVPVELVANGNENALGFSLNFNANVLGFVGASLGLGAPLDAALLVNTNEVAAGRLGLVVGLPADEVFAEGTQQVALVTFLVAPILNQTTVAISFGDEPTLRQLSDDRAEELPAVFVNGIASIADSQFEGDVAPRPNGNRSVATIDWVQMGRFVARLDTISSPNEFQRADCAPRATKGNGLLTVSDWVQAGRYAVGLDPLTVLGGPTEPDGGGAGGFAAASATSSRQLGVVSTSIAQGQTNVVSVTLDCHGNENAASFSVVFDQTKLAFISAAPGAGAMGSLLNLNASETAQGRLGVALAAQPGRTFAAGSREILQLRFSALASAPATVTVSFGNAPVPLEVSDAAANPLPTDFAAAAISVTPPPGPPLRITRSGNSLFITWPSSATGFELEATEGALGTAWSQVPGVISLGEQKLAIINTGGHERYFRLKKP